MRRIGLYGSRQFENKSAGRPAQELSRSLYRYLTLQGIHLIKNRMFSCINTEHIDNNPSRGMYLGNGNTHARSPLAP